MSLTAIHTELMELYHELLDMLANCDRTKELEPPPKCDRENIPDGYWMDSSCKLHRITRITGHINLGGIAMGAGEHQAIVEGGGGIGASSSRSLALSRDRHLAALSKKYSLALEKCNRARQYAESQGSQVLQDGSIVPAAGRKGVQIPCPEADALRKQIAEYLQRTYGNVGPGFTGQGGQFGGGGASAGF